MITAFQNSIRNACPTHGCGCFFELKQKKSFDIRRKSMCEEVCLFTLTTEFCDHRQDCKVDINACMFISLHCQFTARFWDLHRRRFTLVDVIVLWDMPFHTSCLYSGDWLMRHHVLIKIYAMYICSVTYEM